MITVGETLGPYIVEALIAQGGMGAVFRARNRVTGQLRALKVVRPDLVKEQDFAERFVREVTIASGVRHPNLVETLEPGIDGDIIYLPMELLIGETLAARLKRMQRFSSAETAAVLVPIADAVQALHDKGLVHRDLKPMNIFIAAVDGRDVPKVIDLGTARDQDDAEHTRTGLVVGSPYYMAVEQAEGRKDIDGRADQYALGVIAYQMLTGARPYESDDTRSALAKLLRGEPYIPPSRVFPGVTGPVEQVVARALAHDRAQRYPRVADFGASLAAAVHGQGVAGAAPSRVPVSPPALAPQRQGPVGVGQGLGQSEMLLSTATVMAPEGEVNPLEAAMKEALAMTGGAGGGAGPVGAPVGGFAGAPPAGNEFAGPPAFAAPPVEAPSTGRSKILWVLAALAILGVVSAAGAWWITRPAITATSLEGPELVPIVVPPGAPPPLPSILGTPPVSTPPVVTTPVVTAPVVTAPVVTPPVVTPPVVTAPVVTAPVVTPPVVTPPVVTPPVVTPPVVRPPVVTAPVVTPPPTTTHAPTHVPTTTTTTHTPTTTTTHVPSTTTTHTDPAPGHRTHAPPAPCGAATGIPCLE